MKIRKYQLCDMAVTILYAITALGIGNEVNTHFRIFIANAAYLLMKSMGGLVIINFECKVKFIVTQLIRRFAVPEPRQLQLMNTVPILQIHNDKTAVFRCYPANFPHTESILIEADTFLKIKYIEIIMHHSEFHTVELLS